MRSYETCLYILLYVCENVKMFFSEILKIVQKTPNAVGDMRNDTYLWENEGRIRQKYSNVRRQIADD